MKRATGVKSVQNSNLFTEYILHNKFAAVTYIVKGQFLPAMENGAIITPQNPQSNIIKQGRTKL